MGQSCVCLGAGTVLGAWVFGREPACTCGMQPDGEPWSELVLHSSSCDTVPCPFCMLAGVAG